MNAIGFETSGRNAPRIGLVRRNGWQAEEPASLNVAVEFLSATLHLWDEDRIRAKARVEEAATLLRGYARDEAGDILGAAPPTRRRCLEDCASQVDLSPSYFVGAFKATFGTTVCHYIRRLRLERAQQITRHSKQSQSQIALACGFADQAHYCRSFREEMGLSPIEWRRLHMSALAA